jgi:hypothetical protein
MIAGSIPGRNVLTTKCAKSYIGSPCPSLKLHAIAARKSVVAAFHQSARMFRGAKVDVRASLMGPAGLDLSDDA